ncbi:MAG TPA: hypothetical protein VJZ71_10605 [Phycisphaerae bacterium]|nr:hypothetical protein [Phycisphaerae bacterium]
MVFVLGVLTLLALVGLVMIARTHGESRRLKIDSVAANSRSVMDGIIQTVQERLRQDIWGPDPDPDDPATQGYPIPLNSQAAGNLRETNEPWDAPGLSDRWLASTTPYMFDEDGDGNPDLVPTGNTTPGFDLENGVLVWRNVSYLGIDLLDTNGPDDLQPFAWLANSRVAIPTPVGYTAAALENVRILQTPPPGITGDLIPGSTTNVTIANARLQWDTELAALQPLLAGQSPRFPYFDTNSDGAVDLYDADGDGVPDSPISFIVPMDTADPNSPRQLYAAIRIVDHASMLNVNVASSMRLPSGSGTEPMFDELLPGLQRRGRRMTELLLDDVLHPSDRFTRAREMVNARSGDDPVVYDSNIIRRLLAGGSYAGPPDYFLYGLSDEASLRHRGMMAPYDRRLEAAALPTDKRTIDRALRGTLAWSREIDTTNGNYIGASARWTRLNSNFVAGAPVDEGYDDAGPPFKKGWRWMLREDELYAIRRQLLTTISREASPPPPGILFDQSPPGDRIIGLPLTQARFASGSNNLSTMNWPVLDRVTWPAVPDWMRVLPIDLNMRTQVLADIQAMKETYITYLAGAVFRALEGVGTYQGNCVQDDCNGATAYDETLNREYFAWQFAVNAADYRDADNIPTILEWPAGSGHHLYGTEKQPFITEAYAYLTAGDNTPGPAPIGLPGDEWFHAVELYVPPYWRIPTVDPNNPGQPILYLHSRNVTPNVLIPINTFQQIPGGATLNELYGDPATGGTYYVFCGPTGDAPVGMNVNGFYRHPSFKFADTGNAEIELVFSATGSVADPFTHTIDVLSADYSGGTLAGGSTSGGGKFGKNNGFGIGSNHEFSLLRSTKGWRFTTGWQVYSKAPSLIPTPPPVRESLGAANNTSDSLDDNIPPSVWPGRVALNGNNPPESFGPGEPFDAFDSPAEINRLYMFGPIRRALAAEPPYLLNRSGVPYGVGVDIPVTLLLAEILSNNSISDLTSITPERISAGRLDFVKPPPSASPWPTKLLSWFTTTSPLFDGIDNDGDGSTDLADPILGPTEGVRVLNRVAGRININTAPVSVLRAVPFMGLLPNSVEFLDFGTPSGNPVSDFAGGTGLFYDLASAIVAARENRRVPVRLPDGSGALQNVATAERAAILAQGMPALNGYFASVSDLDRLTHVVDAVAGNDQLFRADRLSFQPNNSALAVYNHKLIAGDPDLGTSEVFSPDFRYRRVDTDGDGTVDDYVADYVPVMPMAGGVPVIPLGDQECEYTYPGIRARDIYLARWANMLTVRSDVFTAYIALIDDQGHYVQRSQVTLDRSECFRERPERPFVAGAPLPPAPGSMVIPRIVTRTDGSYEEEVH